MTPRRPPPSIDQHSLHCARLLLENARTHLVEVYRLCRLDSDLATRTEHAGKAVSELLDTISTRQKRAPQ